MSNFFKKTYTVKSHSYRRYNQAFYEEILDDGASPMDEECAVSSLTLGRGVFAASWMLFKTMCATHGRGRQRSTGGGGS